MVSSFLILAFKFLLPCDCLVLAGTQLSLASLVMTVRSRTEPKVWSIPTPNGENRNVAPRHHFSSFHVGSGIVPVDGFGRIS